MKGTFSVTEKRKSKLMSKLEFIFGVTQPTARAIASLAGCIIFMLQGVGPVARLRTRAMYSDIREAPSRNQLINLSPETLAEIEFWLTSFDKYNGFPVWPTSPVMDVLSCSDGSDFAWGGYLVKIDKNIAKGVFSEAEANSSLTWRELKATLYVLESFVASLTNKTVKHISDNQAVPLVITRCSKKPHIRKLVLNVVDLCVKNSINLIPERIPRDLNIISDFASKNVDVDDFMLHPDIFAALDILWGPHSDTIDRSSSFYTRQITRFNSHWPNPCSEGIDAFAALWVNENNWLFPPPS